MDSEPTKRVATNDESRSMVIAQLVMQVARLEGVRDEHQREILELGGLIVHLQDTSLAMIEALANQQRMISILIDEYERSVGELPPALHNRDELASKRLT